MSTYKRYFETVYERRLIELNHQLLIEEKKTRINNNEELSHFIEFLIKKISLFANNTRLHLKTLINTPCEHSKLLPEYLYNKFTGLLTKIIFHKLYMERKDEIFK